jgi:hypothetical protein
MPQPAILTIWWSGFQLGAGFWQGLCQAGFWNRWKMAVCVFEAGRHSSRRGNNPAPTCNLDQRMVRISTWGRIWTINDSEIGEISLQFLCFAQLPWDLGYRRQQNR